MDAIVGVYGSDYASRLVFLALHGMQQRAARTTGIATSHEGVVLRDAGTGIVRNYFDDKRLDNLLGLVGIGHIGESDLYSQDPLQFQPHQVFYKGRHVVLVQDGNIVNYAELRRLYSDDGSLFNTNVNGELILHSFARASRDGTKTFIKNLRETFEPIRDGAYAAVMMVDGSLIGARDVHGFRPLVLGRLGNGYILATEDGFFDNISAERIRDVTPGEILVINEKGIESTFLDKSDRGYCLRELLYFSMPDSTVEGMPATVLRHALGRKLYLEDLSLPEADIVISVPDSGNDYAFGYSDASNLPLRSGLIRHHFGGKSFISRFDGRDGDLRRKLRPNPFVVKDKSVIVVDDSILEGIVMREVTDMLRGAGAYEVHWRVASPMLKAICPYGLRTLRSNDDFAANRIGDILSYSGADSLLCLSQEVIDDVIDTVAEDLNIDINGIDFCNACITGSIVKV